MGGVFINLLYWTIYLEKYVTLTFYSRFYMWRNWIIYDDILHPWCWSPCGRLCSSLRTIGKTFDGIWKDHLDGNNRKLQLYENQSGLRVELRNTPQWSLALFVISNYNVYHILLLDVTLQPTSDLTFSFWVMLMFVFFPALYLVNYIACMWCYIYKNENHDGRIFLKCIAMSDLPDWHNFFDIVLVC